MIRIYKIVTAPDAPRLRLADPSLYGAPFMRFDGEEKGRYSPRKAFPVVAEPCDQVRQFYNFAPGVLAGPVAGLSDCHDMLYATDGTERLSLLASDRPFTAVNPTELLSAPPRGTAPCSVDRFYAPVFRIRGRDPVELFCVSGFDVPLDEFKHVYDLHGFAGLVFEEVWRDG